MIEKAKPPEWSPRVPRYKIRRLYQSDTQGIQDNDLADQVGFALLARCGEFPGSQPGCSGPGSLPGLQLFDPPWRPKRRTIDLRGLRMDPVMGGILQDNPGEAAVRRSTGHQAVQRLYPPFSCCAFIPGENAPDRPADPRLSLAPEIWSDPPCGHQPDRRALE